MLASNMSICVSTVFHNNKKKTNPVALDVVFIIENRQQNCQDDTFHRLYIDTILLDEK